MSRKGLSRGIRWLLFGHSAHAFLSVEEQRLVAQAIRTAESRTSGEIRIHLETRCPPTPQADAATGASSPASKQPEPGPSSPASGQPSEASTPIDPALGRARDLFHRLGMTATRQRNAVLLYIALADRRFAIYGDEGIHAAVGEDYWKSIRDGLAARFREGRYAEGLCEAAARIGETLAAEFPLQPGDVNELPDEIDFT